MDIDPPWLFEGNNSLHVNGVDVIAFVEAEFNGGFPAAAAGIPEIRMACARPWNPRYQETILSCLHVIFNEEWEHNRYPVRDLDTIEATAAPDQ